MSVCLYVCLSVPSSTDKTVNPRTLKFWVIIPQVKVRKRVSQIFEFSFFCWVMAFFDISAIYSILNFDSDNRHIGTWIFASRVKMSFWNSKKKCVHKNAFLPTFWGISIFWGISGLNLGHAIGFRNKECNYLVIIILREITIPSSWIKKSHTL